MNIFKKYMSYIFMYNINHKYECIYSIYKYFFKLYMYVCVCVRAFMYTY